MKKYNSTHATQLIALLIFSAIPSHSYCQSESRFITIFIHGTLLANNKTARQNKSTSLMSLAELQKNHKHPKLLSGINALHPKEFSAHQLYSFQWSGQLDETARQQAGQELYHALKTLKKILPDQTKIRIITHSHGGNVALHMADACNGQAAATPLVDELILLACPVFEQTAPLAAHPLFKKIISIYSDTDIMQILDPQELSHHNSGNTTHYPCRTFPANNNLVQICIKRGSRMFSHFDFLKPEFLRKLPQLIRYIHQHQTALAPTEAGTNIDITLI